MTASHLPPIPLTLEPPTFLTPSSLKRASNRISTLHHYHRVELTFCSPLSLYALQVRYVLSQVFDGRAVDNRRTLREFTQSLIDSVEMARRGVVNPHQHPHTSPPKRIKDANGALVRGQGQGQKRRGGASGLSALNPR